MLIPKNKAIKAYKGFKTDMTCKGFQYTVGKTYVLKEKGKIVSPVMCNKGFHACININDIWEYYEFDPKKTIICEVLLFGEVLGLGTDAEKQVSNKITIIRQISWDEVATAANCGHHNSGDRNSGDWNSGRWNSGDRNSGDWNSGHWNSGDWNSGDQNSRNCNSGDRNSGDRNSGDWNSGDRNSGDWNSGNWNSRNCNSGDWNSGDRNSGDWNSGHWNSGDWNSGNWNSGDRNSGYLNTNKPRIRIFNKETNKRLNQIKFPKFFYFDLVEWVPETRMSTKEKRQHTEFKTTGGYLKTYSYKEAWRKAWDNAPSNDRAKLFLLPNYNHKIFSEISGITVKELKKEQNK